MQQTFGVLIGLLLFVLFPPWPEDPVETVLAQAQSAIHEAANQGNFHAVADLEKEWSLTLEKALAAQPDTPALESVALMLVSLYGGIPEAGEKIQNLYEGIKTRIADKAWLASFYRLTYYHLHYTHRTILLKVLTDKEITVTAPEARAAALFYHGEALMGAGDLAGAGKNFARIQQEFPSTSFRTGAEANIQEIDFLKPGAACPEIKLPGLTEGELHLAGFKGKVVLLVFWTSWAPLLPEIAPRLKTLINRFKADPFVLVGVCLDAAKDRSTARQMAVDLGLSGPHGYDPKGWQSPITKQFNLKTMPRGFLIDGSGQFVDTEILFRGDMDFRISQEVSKRKAEIKKAQAEKKKAEAAKKAQAEKKG